MRLFEIEQLAQQRVVLFVADPRIVEDVVLIVGIVEELAQLARAAFGGGQNDQPLKVATWTA
jgi:hypothetical protein